MSDIYENLKSYIKEATLNAFNNEEFTKNIVVEIPRDAKIADYSTNIAMRLAKSLKQNPFDIANKIVEELNKVCKGVDSIEVARPGFINFKMKKSALGNIINEILNKGDEFGRNSIGKGTKLIYEYVSANPTGDLHLGHARGAAWGDSVTRLLNFSGYDCLREYYINDAGNQINMLGRSLIARYFELFNRGEEYPIPEDGYHAQDIIDTAKIIADKDGDRWLNADETERMNYFKQTGKTLKLEQIKKDLEFFRCEFDSWIHETFFYENNNKRINDCLQVMKDKNLTYEKDGAVWLKTSDYGDDKDRVLVKADGSLTYLTPDIANHVYKLERGYSKLVNLWGADHHGYVARMKIALTALGYPKDCLEVDLEQLVRLVRDGEEVKMSKRTGNAVSLRELCEEVGVDAARYLFVCHALGEHMDFDITLAQKKTNDNPVYYAQYAYARSQSVLEKGKELRMCENYELLIDQKEVDLLKTLNDFVDVVSDAAVTRMPNKICVYIQRLAQYFHSYYGSCKINDVENLELTNERLCLVKAVSIVMKNALNLLGVSAPSKM